MNLLGEVGRADLDGLLHVLQRENIRVDHDSLTHALSRLAKRGQIDVELGPDHNPIAHLRRPFIGWT